jgi:type I restriction enzyme M protein
MGETEKENISARLVLHDEIEENNWDLNIGRYLKADAAEVVDVQDALASFDQARTELAAAEKTLLAKLKAAGYA